MAAVRIMVTREASQSVPWVEELRRQGHEAEALPLLRFRSLEVDPEVVKMNFDWILFTSPHCVEEFFAAGLETGQARLGTLGAGTAKALQEAGSQDNLGISAKDGRQLALAFVALAPEGAQVLLPGPRRRGPEVEAILTEAGYKVITLPLYETLPVDKVDLPDDPFQEGDQIFFCSPSAVNSFCIKWTARPAAVAIGETTAVVARKEGFPLRVAYSPDLNAMVQAAGLDSPSKTSNLENES